VQLWGNPVREYSTGYGAALWTRNAARKFLKGIEGATVAVQGFGNVGYWLSHFLTEMGAKVIAIGDIGGAIYNPNGFNPDDVKTVERKTGTVVNYTGSGTRKIGMDELLALNVDILVPAAVEGVINYSNANAVKAKLIMEAANGPVTSDAEEILYKRGIYVFPDIGVNAGGVVMSYLEWVENLQWFIWDEEETKKKLDYMITNAFNRVYDRWQKMNGATIRDAAYIDALDRIYQAMKWRGWI
ncbi:MAG: Glu/Leu/Phe/Val family dehydrogenase, partial [Thermocladium sp.]